MFFSGLSTVGGFSLCSSPAELPQLQLAVKEPARPGGHPPADYAVHSAAVGESVALRVGGDCWYDVAADMKQRHRRHLVLIAGGIGLNPLLAIMRDVARWAQTHTETHTQEEQGLSLTLLYSASTAAELVFRDEVEALARLPCMRARTAVHMRVTRDQHPPPPQPAVAVHAEGAGTRGGVSSAPGSSDTRPTISCGVGRIDAALVQAAVREAGPACSEVLCFVCGPPPMADAMVALARDAGVPESAVRLEKWW